MVRQLWGKKIGMAQVFKNDKVVPVTAIDVSGWYVVGKKDEENDGYTALVVGLLRKKYKNKEFANDWLKKLKLHFEFVKEIKVDELPENAIVGAPVTFLAEWNEGERVDVTGRTKGYGFAGVVKRHGFAGPPGSHGSKMGKRPGSIGFMRKQGRVIKGKKLPGHLGNVQRTTQNLDLVQIEKNDQVILVKGSVPGHTGSLVSVKQSQ